jgi:hypothetical protein
VVMGNMCQQTMGLTVPATFMAVARQGLFFIPTVWILALTLGLPGIQMAQMVADLLTFLCSVPIQTWVLKKLSQPQKSILLGSDTAVRKLYSGIFLWGEALAAVLLHQDRAAAESD